ncbi:hypothetical protein CSUB01_12376 [Colletotrichum sublineola]|uniref:PD-(D/E)XK nuclease-like domain-containing protein n=1 Tax=Colletotrichum sublineola TaxID=1173701 RepID=A0A066X3I0_COLSU|nr:hypothetical protein CSUB01_12376 [Colletotrichum sublineola]
MPEGRSSASHAALPLDDVNEASLLYSLIPCLARAMATEPASQVSIFNNHSAEPCVRICSWLDHVVVDQKPDDDQDVIAVALRKRHRPLTPVSPDQMDHPSKRHRKAMPDEAVIAKTYRSGSKSTLSVPGSSIGSAASSSQISPINQLADRQNQVAPSAIRQYGPDEEDVPLSLHTMWTDLTKYSKGFNVIPKSQEARITTEYPQIPAMGQWFYADDEIRNKLGNAPSVAEVDYLLKEAKVCSNEGYCEASWNMIIHQRVLQLAVPLYAPKSTGKVSFIPW